jgi:peptide/nickel transport system permease protein
MKILSPIAKRACQLLLLSALVSSAVFLLSSLIPGDYFTTHLLDPAVRSETVDRLRHRYGMDQPISLQYLGWLRNAARLDLGYSLYYQQPVANVVADAISKTFWIGMPALVLGFGGGILLGTLHALCRSRILRYCFNVLSSLGLSLPSLVLGLAALLLAAHTRWFPLGSMNSSSLPAPEFGAWLADRAHHILLPVLCLASPILASVERIQNTATRECLGEIHVRAAKARGLSRRRIFLHYILRPALNPVLSTSGPVFGAVLSGSLVLEVIFAWPGLGQVTYDALFNHDLFLLVGCVMGSSLLLLTGNLAADFLLLILDPRIRESSLGAR